MNNISIQASVLAALRDRINQSAGVFAPVFMGKLPSGDGLCMAVSTGRAQSVTLANGALYTLDVALTCRHTRQDVALDTLCAVCEALVKASPLPGGDGWQMTAVRLSAAPGYVDREETKWLYGGAVTVEYAAD